jgi:hypothetical protein
VRWRRKQTPQPESSTPETPGPEAPAPQVTGPATPAPEVTGPQDDAQVLADLRRVVDRFGWAVLHGGGSGPGDPRWSYTVGLAGLEHPEVIVVGLPFEAAETYLNLVGEAVRAGARFSPGVVTTALTDADSPVVFLQVADTSRLAVAEQFAGSVDALQLVWPDSTGKLPWEEGHRNPPHAQPLLGPRPEG